MVYHSIFVDFSLSILDKLACTAALPVGSAISCFSQRLSATCLPSISLSGSICTYFTCADTLKTSYNLWLALPVPSLLQLSQLRQELAEAQAGSLPARSLEISHASQRIYLPVYVVNLWPRLSTIIHHCKAWVDARSTLLQLANSNEDSMPLALDMLNCLSIIGVDSPIPALLYFRTSHLPNLITNSWLFDDHINAGAHFINQHPRRKPSVYVFDTFWIPHLRSNLARYADGALPCSSVADSLVISGTANELLIPVHQPSHWTHLYVNVTRRSYSFCDSLNPSNTSAPRKYITLLNGWLSGILGFSVALLPAARPFELGRQTDGHSCGVAVLSTMACYALGHPFQPWSQSQAKLHRLNWALWLSSTLLPVDSENSSSSIAELPSPAPSSPPSISVHNSLVSSMDNSLSSSGFSDDAPPTMPPVLTSWHNATPAKPPLRQTKLPFQSIPRRDWQAQEKRRYSDRKDEREQQMVLLERHKAQEEMERCQYNRDRKRDQRTRQKGARMLLMADQVDRAVNSLVRYLVRLQSLILIS